MKAPSKRKLTTALAAAALTAPLLLAASGPASAKQSPQARAEKLARKLVKASSAKDAFRHLKQFQAIADSSGGHRAAGSLGHDASAAYVYKQLKSLGYQVSYDEFEFVYTETLTEKLSVVTPAPRDVPIKLMTYTASTPVGGITGTVAAVPVDDTTGCTADDYASGDFTGKIALIQRGGCTFAEKQAAAADAGAIGAIIYNNIDGELNGTIGDPNAGRIPTGGITKADGEALAADVAKGEVTVNLEIREFRENRTTRNVIAETKGGDADNVVMFGAHLDGVAEGPGINDNGSGSAGLLEVARELAKAEKKPTNKVRFAWWSAEEFGLLGSEDYVANLTDDQKQRIKLYLNFDMIASPNYGLFVYDGDDSDGEGAGPGPEGSAQLEKQITDFLDSKGLPHEGTDFSGRSDYGPFIAVGIPSGGTFTGAEGIKTEEQAAKFGGTAGQAYDPCYHAKCDDIGNVSMKAFDANIDVIANAVGRWAHDLGPLSKPVKTTSTKGTGSGGGLHDHAPVKE